MLASRVWGYQSCFRGRESTINFAASATASLSPFVVASPEEATREWSNSIWNWKKTSFDKAILQSFGLGRGPRCRALRFAWRGCGNLMHGTMFAKEILTSFILKNLIRDINQIRSEINKLPLNFLNLCMYLKINEYLDDLILISNNIYA